MTHSNQCSIQFSKLSDIQSKFVGNVVITDDIVYSIYKDLLKCSKIIVIEHGENNTLIDVVSAVENLSLIHNIYIKFIEYNVSRNTTVYRFGGGLPCFNNMDYINTHGISLYIKVSTEELISRLSKLEIEKRPILIDKDITTFIPKQLKEREYFYNKSKYIYDENFNFEWT